MTLDYTDNNAVRAALSETEQKLEQAHAVKVVAKAAVRRNDSIKAQAGLHEALTSAIRHERSLSNQKEKLVRALETNEDYVRHELAPHPLGESVGFDDGEIFLTEYGRYDGGVSIDADRAAKLVAVLTGYFNL